MNKKKIKKISNFISENELRLNSIQDETEKEKFQRDYEQRLESLITDVFENNSSWKNFDDILFELDEEIQKNIKKSV